MLNTLRVWTIDHLGGFSTVEKAIDSLKGDTEGKTMILTRAVRRLFNDIGAEDILKENSKGEWLYKGKVLSDAKKKVLVAEALHFTQTTLWEIFQDDVKYQANKKMFLESKTELDIVSGKLWLYTIDTFKTRLNSMLREKGSFNSK